MNKLLLLFENNEANNQSSIGFYGCISSSNTR